ncbi:cysteine synthase A [Azorhizobium sp. AG788]|uniref:PLP-dependent cysteine synthase family protein n=1 Tax=Azorhizobium sp. AG788 TaxID=2183897 RepID=UPI00105D7CDC|nr:PLP-dependent cysteine synthase family protein [Azorhizobium sp. AG788]TDT91458.1 cysteine synthase A [Azorhizobium sp. AG788]
MKIEPLSAVPSLTSPAAGATPSERDARRIWADQALRILERDARRSADTHLLPFEAHRLGGIDIYLKDESSHPTGSLKHRLARSLFLFGVCNGQIREGITLVEASSGSTAVSEAYFARLLGLPFYAVMTRTTSPEKIADIEREGGRCHFVNDSSAVYAEAAALAERLGGLYVDQFTNAERVTDWRGNNNIAESIFQQMQGEPRSVPTWIVMGAGTGGTSATIGRYLRYRHHATRLCVADPEGSVFYDAFRTGDRSLTSCPGSRIEGIGRPRVEPSFIPEVIDHMIRVPDAASIAAMRVLARRLGRKVGPSTGTAFHALCMLAAEMMGRGETGSLVTLICDRGERYLRSYYDDAWVAAQGFELGSHEARMETFLDQGGPF